MSALKKVETKGGKINPKEVLNQKRKSKIVTIYRLDDILYRKL